MITKKRLIPMEISFLNDDDCLYSVDFRAISENMEYEIPAMWKYENLCPWITSGKFVTVNEDVGNLNYPNNNFHVVLNKNADPRVSIYDRLLKTKDKLDKKVNKLWVAIPHPDADKYCQYNNLQLNFSFSDFVRLNDKLAQKKLLKDKTPKWVEIASRNELESIIKDRSGYIKRKQGSGGYAVFKSDDLNSDFNALFDQSPADWFFEEKADGRSCSIQCVKDESGDVTVFGFSEQIIDGDKFYSGSKILSLSEMDDNIYGQLKDSLEMLSELLKGYVGFFGLDFIIGKNGAVFILEANIRLTAATIPTLLANMAGGTDTSYKEDANLDNILESDIVLAQGEDQTGDVLSFSANGGVLGKYLYIDLKDCKNNPKQADSKFIDGVANIVTEKLSRAVKVDCYNFWPYGWTLSLILADSHCVITSWFLERRIFVDAFCCNMDYDEEKFKISISKYFGASNINSDC